MQQLCGLYSDAFIRRIGFEMLRASEGVHSQAVAGRWMRRGQEWTLLIDNLLDLSILTLSPRLDFAGCWLLYPDDFVAIQYAQWIESLLQLQ